MRHIKGEMKRLEIPENMTLDDFCKQIIENEFMDKVYEEASTLDEYMEVLFDNGEGYGDALNYLDYESDKYFVHCESNGGECLSVWQVTNKIEDEERPSIKTSLDEKNGILKFDVKFDSEDDEVGIYCLENALNGEYGEYYDGQVEEED